jgi:hypothetical protein
MVPTVDEEVVVGGRKGDAVSTDFSSLSITSTTSTMIKLITGEKSFTYTCYFCCQGLVTPMGTILDTFWLLKLKMELSFFSFVA